MSADAHQPQSINLCVFVGLMRMAAIPERLATGGDDMTFRKIFIIEAGAFKSRRGIKTALSMLVAASSLALVEISDASAGCSQQFTNTTCDWRGANCVNHFKSVCTNNAPPVALAPSAKPVIANNGSQNLYQTGGVPSAGVIACGGGNKPKQGIVSNDGATKCSKHACGPATTQIVPKLC
jgi:hypothetical protein